MKDEIYITRFKRLKLLFLLGVSGGIIALLGLAIFPTPENNPFFIGLVPAGLFIFYSYYLALIHWKERYKGQNSKEWAIAFVLTASNIGFIILILYYINNIIPDMKALNPKKM
jgi:uncharacterized membrane protein YbhN (UPF0104 family)